MGTGIFVALGAFVLNMALAFLLMYCFDTADLWKKCGTDSRLRLPQVEDLTDAAMCQISKYVTQEICPAYHYIETASEISRLQYQDTAINYTQLAAWIFLQVPIFLMIPKGLYQIGFTRSAVLCVVIALSACIVGGFIVARVYKKTLKISGFHYSKDDIQRQFTGMKEHRAAYGYKEEFDITEDAELNNYMIQIHSQYVFSVIETVRARAAVRKVIVAITGITYALLLLGSEA